MHMSTDRIESSLMEAATELRDRGPKAHITGSQKVFEYLRDAWMANPNEGTEYNWRSASLIHGAMLVHQGKMPAATKTYNPSLIVDGSVPPVADTCRMLAAMMAVGRAYARHVHRAGSADAPDTVYALNEVKDDRLNRWRGFAELLIIDLYERTGGERSGDLALSLLDSERQPELYAMALQKAGHGNGRVRHMLFFSRPAKFRPEECLYYFN